MLTQRVVKYIADLLPMHCEVCQLPLSKPYPSSGICQHCSQSFAPLPRCQCCGLPTVYEVDVCGQCLMQPPSWHRLYCVGDYQAPLSGYVHQLKYERQFWQARKLASLLEPRIDESPQLITSVPLHWQRQLRRGFNQSELIARSLSKTLNVSYSNLFTRVRSTAQQQGLTKSQRRRNLDKAFRLTDDVLVAHIAIVDDVVTTGSTVRHLCQLLLEAGVNRIDIYCICRTPEPAN
ncbi:competence protein ComF [Vibrio tubiashii]|nr:competence protein ComF [Vibrio tubiashii]